MPFKKGQATPGAGRKGYSYEKEQIEAMKSVLSRTIKKCDKILEGKASEKDVAALESVKQVAMKIMDKLHANKAEVDITSKGEQIEGNPLLVDLSKLSYEELRRLAAKANTAQRGVQNKSGLKSNRS